MKKHMTVSNRDFQTSTTWQGWCTLPLLIYLTNTNPPGMHHSCRPHPPPTKTPPPPLPKIIFQGIRSECHKKCLFLFTIIFYFLFHNPQHKLKWVDTAGWILATNAVLTPMIDSRNNLVRLLWYGPYYTKEYGWSTKGGLALQSTIRYNREASRLLS